MKTKKNAGLSPFLVKGRLEAGCDEAGRGCLAGPVTAAAVILPEGFDLPEINDSKQIPEKERMRLREIIENEAMAWAVFMADVAIIDGMNILNASFYAMCQAVSGLSVKPDHLLIDGNRFRNRTGIPHTCITGGDAKLMPVAAASILAKTHRDDFMNRLHMQFPEYGWDRNKGYPTRFHRNAIMNHGVTEWHRRSFRLTDTQLQIWPQEEDG